MVKFLRTWNGSRAGYSDSNGGGVGQEPIPVVNQDNIIIKGSRKMSIIVQNIFVSWNGQAAHAIGFRFANVQEYMLFEAQYPLSATASNAGGQVVDISSDLNWYGEVGRDFVFNPTSTAFSIAVFAEWGKPLLQKEIDLFREEIVKTQQVKG